MQAVVVYDSVSASLRAIAQSIGAGLADYLDVAVVPVQHADSVPIGGADLVVVGGASHARDTAPETLQDRVTGWIASTGTGKTRGRAVAYDTRMQGMSAFSGRASTAIASALRAKRFDMLEEPESFLVTEANELWPGEEARARAWGHALAQTLLLAAEVSRAGRARLSSAETAWPT